MSTIKTTHNSVETMRQTNQRLRLLAYVHLRNIHNSTGAGRTARQIVEHLAKRSDVDIHILADRSDADRVLPLVGSPWDQYPIHTFEKDTSLQQAKWFLTNSPTAEAFWDQSEVVYCTAESYVPCTKAKLVVTAHDAAYFENTAHVPNISFWKTRLKWIAMFRKLAKRVDLFHTVSEFSAERLAHFYPEIASRIRPVHNGVTQFFFEEVSQEGKNFLSEVELHNRNYVLVPGGLHFRKNAELILDGANTLLDRFPDITIAIVNHNDAAYLGRAKSLGPRLRILGFVSDQALHALYASAQVVWFPSRYEGFGLPIVEAMASGTAVVGSNASSIPEIAGDAALLANPHSADEHVEAISSLLTDEKAQKFFQQLGRERAARFTWDKTAAELRHHFGSIL